MFPGPNAVVYRNEAGEPIGWDYPADDGGAFYCDLCGLEHAGRCDAGWYDDEDEDEDGNEDEGFEYPDGSLASAYPEPFAGFGGE